MAADRARRYWAGFDLGGTKMLAAIFDERFRRRSLVRRKTKALEGGAAVVARMCRTLDEALAEARIDKRQLRGIGIGSPGPLDLNRGVVIQAPNLGWKNVPLRRRFAVRYGCPVMLANDVDVGCYGEYRFGAARGANCVVGIFPGTGIGGACVYEGRLLRGRVNSCMEVGHLKMEQPGRLCGCGRRGCLETIASRPAIAAEAAAAVARGEAPRLAELAGTDLADIRSGVLAEAIRQGDRVVQDIVRQAAARLGLAAANLVNLFAPDVLVLGGGLVAALPKIFVDEVTRVVREEVMETFRGKTRIVAAKLGDEAGILGAAALAAAESGKAGR